MRFLLTLEPLPGADRQAVRARLRLALEALLRWYGFRCTAVVELRDGNACAPDR